MMKRYMSDLLHGLVKSLCTSKGTGETSSRSGMETGREAADAVARDARNNGTILRSSGIVTGGEGSNSFVSVFSRRGEKGVNQDRSIVWKVTLLLDLSFSGALPVDQGSVVHGCLYSWC